MIKRSFLGLTKPRLITELLPDTLPECKEISMPKTVTLLLDYSMDQKETFFLKERDKVKTGQKLFPFKDSDAYVISSVTGTITSISSYKGDFGNTYTAISIATDEVEEIDNEFEKYCKEPNIDVAKQFLACLPGNPSINLFSDNDKKINTIVVYGIDSDLLITTRQYVVKSDIEAIKSGIQLLKKVTGIDNIIMVVHHKQVQAYGDTDIEIKVVDSDYPSTIPHLIMKNILGQVVPEGKSCEDMGVCFLSAESVAAIGHAFNQGKIPVTKNLTLVKKDGSQTMVSTRIGTPISEICTAFGVTLNEKDRIIAGGPMTGSAVYSEDYPIRPDTDAIIVQNRDSITKVIDNQCINCGECIRICPAKVPVNMLIRFLQAGHYETAAEQYDLFSCMECGFCSFVCIARIPIFQYIRLAKHELSRIEATEEVHV